MPPLSSSSTDSFTSFADLAWPFKRSPARPAARDRDLKVAIFHDNFAQMGGAERVAEELYEALPSADLLSTLTAPERMTPGLTAASIRNTWMQWLPAKARLFRAYFLLYPFAIEGANLKRYDLIVTSCFGYAKGVRSREGALHVCYCHTPMRWVWRTQDYLSRERNSQLKSLLLALPLRWLKRWEHRAASRPNLYLANSAVVADRLKRAFNIVATVLPPPIDTTRFAPLPGLESEPPEDFYLILSRLVPYKRFDLAVEACVRTGRRLILIGSGPDRPRLEAIAAGHPNIEFLGRVPDAVAADHARRCRALIAPGEEDFGMTPLEVNAAGRPVVAFKGGGATETIVEGLNGVFFDQPNSASLIDALERFEAAEAASLWDAVAIRRHALTFDAAIFRTRLQVFLDNALAERGMAPLPASRLVSDSVPELLQGALV